MEEMGAQLEHSPHKSPKHLAQETRVSKGDVRTTKKLLKLQPYKTTLVHSLHLCDPETRLNFSNWYLQLVHNGDLKPELTFFSDEACFYFNEYKNTK
jgi:hypothetical protein